jgi:phospholipase A-2-activating protein
MQENYQANVSSGAGQWVNVGTVVDAVGSSGKKVDYLGKEYDYVFDIDIEDGKDYLKLPYNPSQNPYEAASKFITDNELVSGRPDLSGTLSDNLNVWNC